MAAAEIYIELVVTFPEDPKIRSLCRYGADARGLRDLYVQMSLYCKRNLSDGFVPEEELGILVYPDTWEAGQRDADRLVSAKLLERVEGGYVVSAYAKRNRSKAEVLRLAADKAAGGTLGNHIRWHEKLGEFKKNCVHCRSLMDRTTDRTTDRGSESHPFGSDSETGEPGDRNAARAAESGADAVVRGGDSGSADSPELGDFDSSHTDRTTDRSPNPEGSPETETETETDKNPPNPPGGKRRKRRVDPEDYDSDPDFIRFWNAYPLSKGKFEAFGAWQKAVARGDNPESIIKAAEWFRDDPSRNPEKTKWAQGWLNGRRYKEQQQPMFGNNGAFWEN